MRRVFLLAVVITLWYPEAEGLSCQNHNHINGCSIPLGLPFLYKMKFKPACNMHDHCYNCAVHYKKDRSYCDTKFRKDMNNICNQANNALERITCKLISVHYHAAVQLSGEAYFQDQSFDYCKESWVKKCV